MELKYTLGCQVAPGDRICVDLHAPSLLEQHQERLSRWVIETRDQLVRDALIKMGWTPPPEAPHA